MFGFSLPQHPFIHCKWQQKTQFCCHLCWRRGYEWKRTTTSAESHISCFSSWVWLTNDFINPPPSCCRQLQEHGKRRSYSFSLLQWSSSSVVRLFLIQTILWLQLRKYRDLAKISNARLLFSSAGWKWQSETLPMENVRREGKEGEILMCNLLISLWFIIFNVQIHTWNMNICIVNVHFSSYFESTKLYFNSKS